jgi:hypothetical protein
MTLLFLVEFQLARRVFNLRFSLRGNSVTVIHIIHPQPYTEQRLGLQPELVGLKQYPVTAEYNIKHSNMSRREVDEAARTS